MKNSDTRQKNVGRTLVRQKGNSLEQEKGECL